MRWEPLALPPMGDYVFVPAKCVADADLVKFALVARPDHRPSERILLSWWRRATPCCAIAAIHTPTAAMAGLCCGRPAQWRIADRLVPSLAICDWYVAPGHAGQGVGKRMVEAFAAPDRLLYAYSISRAAVINFKKLGWNGPHPTALMPLALPRAATMARRLLTGRNVAPLEPHSIAAGQRLGALSRELDEIELTYSGPARMLRDAKEWSWRLSVCGDRCYRVGLARCNSRPVGYVAVRPMSHALVGRLKAAIITDLTALDDDPMVLRRLAVGAVRLAAEMGVWLMLAVTTTAPHRRALARAGFLSPTAPIIGEIFKARAPEFMWAPHGPGSALNAEAITLTFSDSDLDLNI
jgi:Acetyltransferase (GNAT) family